MESWSICRNHLRRAFGRIAGLVALTALCLLGRSDPAAAVKTAQPLRADLARVFTGDFDAIVAKRRLRVLIPFSRIYFHLEKGEMAGLAVDQLRSFEKQINAGIRDRSRRIFVFIVPTPRDRLLSDLVAGRGDIALGNLTVTEERRATVDFSRPLSTGVRELVVTGPDVAEIRDPLDLAGRAITVRRSSSFRQSLERLNSDLLRLGRPAIVIRDADERLESEDLIEMVQAGLIEATVADSHMLDLWGRVFPRIRGHAGAPIRTDGEIAWAFRKNSPRLAEKIDAFVASARLGTEHGNLLRREHLRSDRWLKPAASEESSLRLKAYWEHFRKYGAMYDVDPHLIAAIAFQESRFDPKLVMRSGATGLLQTMPSIG